MLSEARSIFFVQALLVDVWKHDQVFQWQEPQAVLPRLQQNDEKLGSTQNVLLSSFQIAPSNW
jgi:hypothetical protein